MAATRGSDDERRPVGIDHQTVVPAERRRIAEECEDDEPAA